ncbi:hypothetical protein B1K54_25985 [Streptomyces sp. fd1-xmd]|nr:hypothetical protein B1K54_25985 [Streptomyces sp. fd1-xmd]
MTTLLLSLLLVLAQTALPTARPVVRPLPAPLVVARWWDPPPTPYAAGHRGVDLAAPVGAELRAVAAGRVHHAGQVAGRGVLSLALPTGLRTTYEPVRPLVAEGEEVAAGQVVAVLAEGSHCPAPCLHWGLLSGEAYLNPLTLLARPTPRLLPDPHPDARPGPGRGPAADPVTDPGPTAAPGVGTAAGPNLRAGSARRPGHGRGRGPARQRAEPARGLRGYRGSGPARGLGHGRGPARGPGTAAGGRWDGAVSAGRGGAQPRTPRSAMARAVSVMTSGSSAAPSSIRRTAASTTPWSSIAASLGSCCPRAASASTIIAIRPPCAARIFSRAPGSSSLAEMATTARCRRSPTRSSWLRT